MSLASCHQLSIDCPVEATLYGYRPNLGANALFVALFSIGTLCNGILGYRTRWWSYLVALLVGSSLEVVGYTGRVLLWKNPYDTTAFSIQFICLVIAPTFLAAGVYLGLKHLVIRCGQENSILRPSLYTWIFISADVSTLILQAIGAVLFTTGTSPSSLKLGTDIALAGIILQVVALAVFGLLAGSFLFRTMSSRRLASRPSELSADRSRLGLFIAGQAVAYTAVLIRRCYRIPELSSGFGSDIFRSEVKFTILDGAMMALAMSALSVFHPGLFLTMKQSVNMDADTENK